MAWSKSNFALEIKPLFLTVGTAGLSQTLHLLHVSNILPCSLTADLQRYTQENIWCVHKKTSGYGIG